MSCTSTKSILRYPGSKARYADLVASFLDACPGKRPSVLVEPFCGGASVSLDLLMKGVVDRIVLNDVDPLIAALWSCVFKKEDAAWLISRVYSVALTLDEWEYQKSLVPINRREAAFKCLYLNRTSFNGVIHKSGPIGGRSQSKRNVGARFNREFLAEKIAALCELRDAVTVTNYSWQMSCCKSAKALGESGFFYLDPPYYHKAKNLYGYAFSERDHHALKNYLVNLANPWVLFYDDTQEVQVLYSDERLFTVKSRANYSMFCGGQRDVGKEIIFSNISIGKLAQQQSPREGIKLSCIG